MRLNVILRAAMRVLNVAEKNDAAKNLANIMSRGASNKREGLSKYNKIFDFNYTIPQFGNCEMTMTSVSGHLFNYDFTDKYRNWNGCDPRMLFSANVVKLCSADGNNIKRTLERESQRCGVLIVWTDCDREGENIGYEVINVCRAVNAQIRVFRAQFSEITANAVLRAVNNLKEPDKRVSDAVDVRQELDLRIGAAFTRFQTFLLQKRHAELRQNVVSYGSCQFPTLGFVVERYKQRINFIPEKFWSIDVNCKRNNIDACFKWKRQRLFDQQICLGFLAKVMEKPEAKVIGVNSKRKTRMRPFAMDTVTLEKLASSKLRITAKRAMDAAEKLYTKGFISYPRTETNQFPADIRLQNYVEMQIHNAQWGQFAARILEEGINPRNGKKTDKAHPPIHPTKGGDTTLYGDEPRVYELIVRHFLACLSRDAIGNETAVDIEVNEEMFNLKGLIVTERNYLEVYPYDSWNSKEIPRFTPHEQFTPDSIMMTDGLTTAPQLLTEAELIALMDKHGIGTDATHAEHIEKIKFRNYIQETSDRRLAPQELGIGLVDGYDDMGYEMSKPHLRAALELDLQAICDGRKTPDDVLRNQIRQYERVFLESVQNAIKLTNSVSKYLNEKIQLPNVALRNRNNNNGNDDDDDNNNNNNGGSFKKRNYKRKTYKKKTFPRNTKYKRTQKKN